MDGNDFDALTRNLAGALPRRTLGSLGIGVALASLLPTGGMARLAPHRLKKGKKGKGKKKHRRLVLNQFGCVDVGGSCQGNSANCCSGICQGKKPKPGEKDRSVCVGHNEDSCTFVRSICVTPLPASNAMCNPAVPDALCLNTTGNGVFCADFTNASMALNCKPCAKDADCLAFGFPPGSACALLTGFCAGECASSGNRGCFPPGI